MTALLEKLFELIHLLLSQLELSRKWRVWLIYLPATLFWLWLDMDIIMPFLLQHWFYSAVAAAAWIGMWWDCRQERWLWFLPYLCLIKTLMYLIF